MAAESAVQMAGKRNLRKQPQRSLRLLCVASWVDVNYVVTLTTFATAHTSYRHIALRQWRWRDKEVNRCRRCLSYRILRISFIFLFLRFAPYFEFFALEQSAPLSKGSDKHLCWHFVDISLISANYVLRHSFIMPICKQVAPRKQITNDRIAFCDINTQI